MEYWAYSPTLTNSATDSASEMTEEEKGENEGYIIEESPLVGLSATEVYLKMKEDESKIETLSDYLEIVNTYYSKVYKNEIWHEYINTNQEERIGLVQKTCCYASQRTNCRT